MQIQYTQWHGIYRWQSKSEMRVSDKATVVIAAVHVCRTMELEQIANGIDDEKVYGIQSAVSGISISKSISILHTINYRIVSSCSCE